MLVTLGTYKVHFERIVPKFGIQNLVMPILIAATSLIYKTLTYLQVEPYFANQNLHCGQAFLCLVRVSHFCGSYVTERLATRVEE